MTISEILLPEFEQEMLFTRSVLERVPDEHTDWRPHDKSYTLGELATHVANLPQWVGLTLDDHEFDISNYQPDRSLKRKELLAAFDKHAADASAALARATDAEMLIPWTLRAGGKALFTLPRSAVFRTFVISHMIHHRGQLTVYLRMKDVPLPSIYGPSADTRD